MRIVALLAAYNEADIIGQVVADLIAQGVSVHLIDHGSTDGTAEAVRPWLDRGLLAIEPFADDKFAWDGILERKQQLAQLLDADWFLHTDADELRESPFPERTLAQAIADVDRLGYNAIDFAVFNFAPTDDDFTPDRDLRAHFLHYEPAPLFDRLQIKCWKKQPSVDLRASGGHEAGFEGRRVFPIRFLDRHYPVRSQAQGERKVFRERKPRFVEAERLRGWHVQYDHLEPGHRFIREASELRQFDAWEARRELFEGHRGAEAAEEKARTLAAELAQRKQDLAIREEQLEEWRGEAQKARRAHEASQKSAESERQAKQQLAAELLARTAECQALRAELEAMEGALHGAEVRIDEIYASRTWRWTATGRLLWELLRKQVG